MDCNMPVMDGYESTTLIKDYLKKRNLKDVPIVAVTAYTGAIAE